MRKRKVVRTWEQHEAEIADNMRRPSNARSPHTAAWHPGPAEDLALSRLPMKLRRTLTERSEGVLLPPSEVLHNSLQLGNDRMLLTLFLILRAAMLEAYGEEHPSVKKLTHLILDLEESLAP